MRYRRIIICGPGGSGKDHLRNAFKSHDNCKLAIPMTTREPRPGETPGYTYNYVSRESFREYIIDRLMREWTYFAGNYYGHSKADWESCNIFIMNLCTIYHMSSVDRCDSYIIYINIDPVIIYSRLLARDNLTAVPRFERDKISFAGFSIFDEQITDAQFNAEYYALKLSKLLV